MKLSILELVAVALTGLAIGASTPTITHVLALVEGIVIGLLFAKRWRERDK